MSEASVEKPRGCACHRPPSGRLVSSRTQNQQAAPQAQHDAHETHSLGSSESRKRNVPTVTASKAEPASAPPGIASASRTVAVPPPSSVPACGSLRCSACRKMAVPAGRAAHSSARTTEQSRNG